MPDTTFIFDCIEHEGRNYFHIQTNYPKYRTLETDAPYFDDEEKLCNLYRDLPGSLLTVDALQYANATRENAALISKDFSKYKFTEKCDEAVRRLLGVESISLTPDSLFIPRCFKQSLLPHQEERLPRVLNSKKMLLAWRMGRGKTKAAIYCVCVWKERREINRTLIICPAALRRDVWEVQLQESTTLSFNIADGPKAQRLSCYASDSDITVISYEAAREDQKEIKKSGYDCFIPDESSLFKNSVTATYKALREIAPNPHHGIALNGTPIENHDDELLYQLLFLFPELDDYLFTSLSRYPGSEAKAEAMRLYLSDYLDMLKGESEWVAEPELVEVELSPLQRKVYTDLSEGVLSLSEDTDKDNALGLMVRLQQCVDDVSLIFDSYGEHDGKSAKFAWCKSYFEAIRASGKKVLFFTQYKVFAEKIARDLGTPIYAGTGRGVSKKSNRVSLQKFKQDPDCHAMVATKAAARGLNVPELDEIILIDFFWNPRLNEQIVGRGDRIDRTKPMTVKYLIAKDTFEISKYRRVEGKREEGDVTLQGLDDLFDQEGIAGLKSLL